MENITQKGKIFSQLMKKYVQLQKKYQQLDTKFQHNYNQINPQNEYYQQLEKELQKLRQNNSILKEQNQKLKQTNDSLINQIQDLKNINQQKISQYRESAIFVGLKDFSQSIKKNQERSYVYMKSQINRLKQKIIKQEYDNSLIISVRKQNIEQEYKKMQKGIIELIESILEVKKQYQYNNRQSQYQKIEQDKKNLQSFLEYRQNQFIDILKNLINKYFKIQQHTLNYFAIFQIEVNQQQKQQQNKMRKQIQKLLHEFKHHLQDIHKEQIQNRK